MKDAGSMHVPLHVIVLSGVSSLGLPPCRCVCRADVNPMHWTLRTARRPAQPSPVQMSCLERAWPAASGTSIGAFAGALTAHAAVPPGRRRRERKRQVKAEGKTKGVGTQPPAKPVCTWGWRGTTRLCRRAAGGAWPAPKQGWPRASHARTRYDFLKERP
ncbi:hypothetical protein CSC67_00930 [Pusillimonas caeni]|nr:hypothetical protein CSC67_00930 [Pusillimonas caeni]